jgi:polysaccharide biosynthesis protein PslG
MVRPTRRRLRGAVLFLTIVVCIVSAQAAPHDRLLKSLLGVVVFDINSPASERLSELGVGLVRGSCFWKDLEPTPGVFNWGCTDNVIVGAQEHGWRSYMTVTCTPDWASSGSGCAEMPADLTVWYDFVARFVARYRLYSTILGIWNEPNLLLHDDAMGRNYALLFINASNARNAVDPFFVLAGPETSHHALASGYFANTMDLLRSWRTFGPQDIVSVHWYRDGPQLPDYMDAINAVAFPQTVWLSETGFASPDLAAQADFFDSVLTVFASDARPWWTHLIFYRLWDGQDCCSEAILRADYTPKPAFDTFQSWLSSAQDPGQRPRPLGLERANRRPNQRPGDQPFSMDR